MINYIPLLIYSMDTFHFIKNIYGSIRQMDLISELNFIILQAFNIYKKQHYSCIILIINN